jgi:peroxiredoxin
MTNNLLHKIIPAFIFMILISSNVWAGPPPAVGGTLPDFSVATPKDGEERSYLGLGFFSDSFKIPGLKAQVAIIQIFSMYCPYCQAEAPNVNRLYDKIEGSPSLKGKIKLIGIGAGNSSFEVGVFKKKYNIRFPLIPDKDFKIYDRIGEVRTPYFIGIKISSDGSHRVVYSHLGALGNVDKFLEELIKLADLH